MTTSNRQVSIGFRLYVAQHGQCFHCGQPMKPSPARKTKSGASYDLGWTREHVIPVSKGGINANNIVLAHHKCNSARGNQDPTPEMLTRTQRLHLIVKDMR